MALTNYNYIIRPADEVPNDDEDAGESNTFWGLPKRWLEEQEEDEEEERRYELRRPYSAYCYTTDEEDQRMMEPSEGEGSNPSDDEVGDEGGEQAKRIKLSDDDPSASAGQEIDPAEQERQQLVEKFQTELFNFNLYLADRVPIEHDSSAQEIFDLIDARGDMPALPALPGLPPQSTLLELIHRKIRFKGCLHGIRAEHQTVKLLYEHVPKLPGSRTIDYVKRMVDHKSSPFAHLKVADLYAPIQIYDKLLRHAEGFFHPLIRKSYKKEFFSFVDAQAKLEEREFIMRKWRTYSALFRGGPMLKQLVRSGLHDKEYDRCCRQIRLQEQFDYHLFYCANVEHDSVIEDLLYDEAVIPKKFKDLDLELKRLSLQACINICKMHEERKSCCRQLQILENASRHNETTDLVEMLIALYSAYPNIFSLPMECPVDNDLEERLKEATAKMKAAFFPEIADYRVLEITLLYMKHLVSKGNAEESSWSTEISKKMKFFWIMPEEICHEHRMYSHVINVETRLA